MSDEIEAYRELVGAHPCKRWSATDFACLINFYGPIFGLRLLTGKQVDETMHALDRARARRKELTNA